MKPNIFKILQIFHIPIHLFLIITNLNAITNQYDHTIKIHSSSQTTNLSTNTITFQGKVILKYQNLNIQADEICIHHISDKCSLPIVKAYGNPVHLLYQTQKLNDTISAQSLIMHYNINKNIIILIGNAYIKQAENSIYSDNITYTIKEKKIQATADHGKQVITNFFIKN